MQSHQQHASDPDFTFDILRGLAQYTDSNFIRRLAYVVTKYPRLNISEAMGYKQIASKTWLRDELFNTLGGDFQNIWVLGGWYATLSAILFDDARFQISHCSSIDIDPECEALAIEMNLDAHTSGHFSAITKDMYELDYPLVAGKQDLVINTSCEHIPNLREWLELLPTGTRVLLQSNDYFSEPEHINCVESLETFRQQAGLSQLDFSGELETKKYTRFMLIGET